MLALGGVTEPSRECLSIGSEVSGLTTTMGGAGATGAEYCRWGTAPPSDEEMDRPEPIEPLVDVREWLLVLDRLLRLATAETGWGRGLFEFGGGGGGAAAAAAAAFASFDFEEEDSCDLVLLSCRTVSESASGMPQRA